MLSATDAQGCTFVVCALLVFETVLCINRLAFHSCLKHVYQNTRFRRKCQILWTLLFQEKVWLLESFLTNNHLMMKRRQIQLTTSSTTLYLLNNTSTPAQHLFLSTPHHVQLIQVILYFITQKLMILQLHLPIISISQWQPGFIYAMTILPFTISATHNITCTFTAFDPTVIKKVCRNKRR